MARSLTDARLDRDSAAAASLGGLLHRRRRRRFGLAPALVAGPRGAEVPDRHSSDRDAPPVS